MNAQVVNKFVASPSYVRAQLIGSSRNFIKDDNFNNLLQNIDINNVDIKNGNKPTSIHFIGRQLAAFNGIPGLADQVASWLSSA
jgi:hypothetical protein